MSFITFTIGETTSKEFSFQKQNKTTGSLFQQKTKAKILVETINEQQENYLVNCFSYLHRNPLTNSLVKELKECPYSSYPDYIGLKNGTLCDKKLFFSVTRLTPEDITNAAQSELTDNVIEKFY